MMFLRKKKFRVEVEGRNFLVLWEQTPHKYGFHTMRYVSARDEAGAEKLAVRLLSREFKAFVLNLPDDKPMYRVVSITPLETFGAFEAPGEGAEWYLE